MDLDTFLTRLYVVVDDWYKLEIQPVKPVRCGASPRMSDSEVLTVALAGQWQVGTPWRSERAVVRYMQAHGRQWFPTMLQKSAFNRRVRDLCGVFAALQRFLVALVSPKQSSYEVEDGLPLPVCSLGQAARSKRRWLMQTSRGHGGTQGGWFHGQRWWASVTPQGAITGWMVADAHVQERWLHEAFLSQRAGDGEVHGPLASTHEARSVRATPSSGFIGGAFAAGAFSPVPYLADRGLNGKRWRDHLRQYYHADVLAPPSRRTGEAAAWLPAHFRWLAGKRQIVETVFALMSHVFGVKHLNAHSQWGQYTRLAAKSAALNMALYFNRCLNRPLLAVSTLLC